MSAMKLCNDLAHEGCDLLPSTEFYAPQIKRCRECCKRRARERDEQLRVERKARLQAIVDRKARERAGGCMIEHKLCRDPMHIDVGPLSESGDFYQSSGRVCKVCHKRRMAAVNKGVAARMRDGLEREIYSRRGEESPAEEARKLRELEATYQHSASEVQTSPNEPRVVCFDQTEGFNSSYPVTSLFLRSGEPKPKPRWGCY